MLNTHQFHPLKESVLFFYFLLPFYLITALKLTLIFLTVIFQANLLANFWNSFFSGQQNEEFPQKNQDFLSFPLKDHSIYSWKPLTINCLTYFLATIFLLFGFRWPFLHRGKCTEAFNDKGMFLAFLFILTFIILEFSVDFMNLPVFVG